MEDTSWIKQESGKPYFGDLLWARPENKLYAGKLLIVGGNLHGFAAPAEAYQHAAKAGAGTIRVLLPDAVRKIVGMILDVGEFAPSTPSGSFSQKALLDWLECATWADAVLIAGDMGRNSETAILMEKFLTKSSGPVTLAKDAVNYVITTPSLVLERPDTTLVLSMAQLQKLGVASGWTTPITFAMDLLRLITTLQEFTATHAVRLVVKQHNTIIVAVGGMVSTTKLQTPKEIWRVETAAHTAVWNMQNPAKPFEALSVAVTEV